MIIFVAVAVTEGETGQHRNDEYCWAMAGGREREREREFYYIMMLISKYLFLNCVKH